MGVPHGLMEKDILYWAMAIVESKALGLGLEIYKEIYQMETLPESPIEEQGVCALISLIDAPRYEARKREKDPNTGFQVNLYPSPTFLHVAERDFDEGQEYVQSYNGLDNLEILRKFGTVVKDNPDDRFHMKIQGKACF